MTAAASAQGNNSKEMWVDKFHFDQTDLSIVAISKSGEYPEDDMTIFIRQGKDNIKIPLVEGWYETAKVITDLNLLSENSSVFKIDSRYLLILLSRNNRPLYRQTALVLYDYQKKKVADVKEDIGELKECYDGSLYLLESMDKYAFRIRLVREYSKLTDGPESAIEDWFLVSIQNGKLICKWR
jgi:hypothetical protein